MQSLDRMRRFSDMIDLGLDTSPQRVEMRRPSEMNVVLDRLENWMRVHGYPRKDLFAVKLALHEAVSNAFQHGNRHDPAKSVRLRYLVTTTEVLLSVEDQGPGFDPEQVPDPTTALDVPHGRGLLLMRSYATWMNIEPPGNRVVLCRLRS